MVNGTKVTAESAREYARTRAALAPVKSSAPFVGMPISLPR